MSTTYVAVVLYCFAFALVCVEFFKKFNKGVPIASAVHWINMLDDVRVPVFWVYVVCKKKKYLSPYAPQKTWD